MIATTPPVAVNPFLALRSFKRADASRFFGRDADLVLIQSRLFSARCTLLFAAAGVGKSSFLDAKLAPAVESQWQIVTHRSWAVAPPLPALQASVAAAAAASDAAADLDLVAQIERMTTAPGDTRGCLIVLDQFEEVFQHWRDSKALDAFASEVARLVHAPGLEARILISMREEFLGELSLFDNLIPDLFNNCYRLKNATRGEAEEIVTRTAMLCGIECGPGLDALLDDLVNASSRIDAARRAAPAPHGEPSPRGRIPMPFLQIVCYRLWKQQMLGARPGAVFLDAPPGPVRGELEAYCREKLKTLSAAEQDLAAAAFGFLMTRSGAKMAYPIDVLAEQAHVNEAALLAVLDRLAAEDVRILREIPGGPNAKPWFELYHDLYSRFLSDWKREHDARRDARRGRRSMTMAALLILSAVTIAGLASWRASRQQVQHIADQLLPIADEMARRADRETALGIRLRLESFARDPDQAREGLRTALAKTVIALGTFDLPTDPDLIAVSPNHEVLCTVDGDTLWLSRLPEGLPIGEARTRAAQVSSVAFDAGGATLAAAGWDGKIEILRTADARLSKTIDVMAGALLTGVAFSPDGTMVAVSGDSSDDTMHFARVYRRDAEDGQPLEVRHEAAVSVLAFTPDGRYLVSGTTRGQGVVTDLQTSESTRFSHGARIVAVAFKPHGQLLATVSADGLAKIWTIPQLTELVLDGQTSRSSDALAFSPDGRYLLTGQDLLWDLKIDPALARPAGFGSPTAVAFTSDGETIVAAGATGAVLVSTKSLTAVDALAIAPVRMMELDQTHDRVTLASGGSVRSFILRLKGEPPPTTDADLEARACALTSSISAETVKKYLADAPLLACRR